MNSLSWLILSINILENFTGVLQFFTVATSIVTGFLLLLHLFVGDSESDEWHGKHFKRTMKFMFLPIALIIISIFVPSSRTVYLIAASEVGERVINQEKVVGLIDPSIDILKNYITLENQKIQEEMKKLTEKRK